MAKQQNISDIFYTEATLRLLANLVHMVEKHFHLNGIKPEEECKNKDEVIIQEVSPGFQNSHERSVTLASLRAVNKALAKIKTANFEIAQSFEDPDFLPGPAKVKAFLNALEPILSNALREKEDRIEALGYEIFSTGLDSVTIHKERIKAGTGRHVTADEMAYMIRIYKHLRLNSFAGPRVRLPKSPLMQRFE